MKRDKMIAKTAAKIAKLEKQMYTMDDVSSIEAQIDKIVSELSAEDMVEIDNYIEENNLLTK